MIVRRLALVILVLSLLLALVFVQKLNIPRVKASPDIHQGDLVLTGNNVTTIEDLRFDINGSIIVEENATLILRNAILNFTQTDDYQHTMIFRNPVNGNPRLQVENATITASGYYFHIDFYGNSTGTINKLEKGTFPYLTFRTYDSSVLSTSNLDTRAIYGYDTSKVNVSNSTLWFLSGYESCSVTASNCTIGQFSAEDSSIINVSDSEIGYWLDIESRSVNCSITGIMPGLVTSWNYLVDCSVLVSSGGYAPNVTVHNTQINEWIFDFWGSSNVTISNSTLRDLVPRESSIVTVTDSRVYRVYAHDSSVTWMFNSTSNYYYPYHESKIYVYWYLAVHVIDSISQNVPSANVTAAYPNLTVAESKLTDANGWAMLILMEKMMNATGEYPVGNYTVEATYETYSNGTIVNITENQVITLTLADFIIPEFPSFLILPLFMMATLVAVIVYKRKHTE